MNELIKDAIRKLVGQQCSRSEVGQRRSFSLGFGNIISNKTSLNGKSYREWELGTFRCAWRVVQKGKVVCASQDAVDTISELNHAIERIKFGSFVSIRQLTDLDVRVELTDGINIDFLTTISDDDEGFHIFCPNEVYVEFSSLHGWRVGKSRQP